MKLELTICRASEAVERVKNAEQLGVPFDAVISLEHPGCENLTAAQGRAPRLADEIGPEWNNKQLVLSCWDVEHDRFGVPMPDQNIVTDAIDFIDKLSLAGRPLRLLVHCRSGKARSTALGLVLLLYKNGDEILIEDSIEELLRVRTFAAPNIALIRHGDEILGYGGKLVAAIEANTDITERRAESERRRIHQVESRRMAKPTP